MSIKKPSPLPYKWFVQYCKREGITHVDGAKYFGVSVQFLYNVLKFRQPCPPRIVRKMSKLFGIDIEVVGIAFGYYATDWVKYNRKYPDRVQKMIEQELGEDRYGKNSLNRPAYSRRETEEED